MTFPGSGQPLNHYAAGGSSKSGVIALVCGIISLFLVIPAIPAIIFGVKGIREGRLSGSGVGLSIAGVVLGGLTLLLAVVGIVVAVG